MIFETAEEKMMFLYDKPYYRNPDSFCLGNTLDEAGEIMKTVQEEAERRNNCVGMDIGNVKQTVQVG